MGADGGAGCGGLGYPRGPQSVQSVPRVRVEGRVRARARARAKVRVRFRVGLGLG